MKAYARLTSAARQAQLLDLGRRMFLERTYDELSMDDVAEVAGVSKGLLYHYFPSKREFYLAILRSAVEEMLAIIEPDQGLVPAERLRRSLEGYLGYVESHAVSYRAVLRGGVGSDPEVVAIADRFRDAVYERIVESGEIGPPGPALELAIRGWIGFVEAASLVWVERREPSREVLADLLIETLTADLARWGAA